VTTNSSNSHSNTGETSPAPSPSPTATVLNICDKVGEPFAQQLSTTPEPPLVTLDDKRRRAAELTVQGLTAMTTPASPLAYTVALELFSQAATLAHEVVEAQPDSLADRLALMTLHNNMAACLRTARRGTEAQDHLERAWALRAPLPLLTSAPRELVLDTITTTGQVGRNLAKMLLEEHHAVEATELLQTLFTAEQTVLGPDHPNLIRGWCMFFPFLA
jgi:hypothetical protein